MSTTRDWRGVGENIRRAATRRGRARLGCCVVEGLRVHERALRAGSRVEAALISESFHRDPGDRGKVLLRALHENAAAVLIVPDEAVHELSAGRERGLVGLVALPPRPVLRDLLVDRAGLPTGLIVAVEIEDPGNVGALARTTLASGAAALVSIGITDPWHPKAVRTSMGSVFKLPLPAYETAAAVLDDLRALDARALAAVSTGGTPVHRFEFDRRPVAFFVGSEAFGLPDELARALDGRVSVPMAPGVDSFSVNAAAAVLLYEVGRQTGGGPTVDRNGRQQR